MPLLNNEHRLNTPPGGIKCYFLSHRGRTDELACFLLKFLQCFRVWVIGFTWWLLDRLSCLGVSEPLVVPK